jgi:lipid-A-disaccharide synthase
VIVYRLSALMRAFLLPLVTTKYITLVNLLADKMLFPELPCVRCQAPALAEHVLHWLNDGRAYAELCGELLALRERCARPGACDRAAGRIVEVLERRQVKAA